MRITNNTIADNIVSQIQNLGQQQAKWQNQVSTGQRIFQPEDDPAAVGRVLNLQTEQRNLAQFQGNAAHALEVSQASFSGLQAIKTISDRATQIGTLGSGALNSSQTQAYASEVNQLLEQTLQTANSKFGNDYLYGGTVVSTPPFVATRDAQGNITGVSYAGNATQAGVPISETATITPNTDGATNASFASFMNNLVSLRDALNTGNTATIQSTQTNLVNNEDTLVSAIAENGGVQSRIEATQSQQQDRSTDLTKLVSNETDVDMPSTIVKLTQTQTAYQAALQSAASIMKMSLLDYIQ
ncbi:MAG TPA: flagellar hook-associated protein FlgL [Opitutaceae bacterium]|nr:flagellar hook-associated protein FlgL [Opitutaceae bacterium]